MFAENEEVSELGSFCSAAGSELELYTCPCEAFLPFLLFW